MNASRVAAALCLLLLWPGGAGAQEAVRPVPLTTWAAIVAEDLRSSPVADLVSFGLATDSGLTLVDREHLDLLAKELSLWGLTDPSATSERIKAGRLLKADVLVILGRQSADGKEFVRMTICECRSGARLAVDCVALADGRADQAAATILADIRRCRTRFADGVTQVFGVPPFVSRSLTHQYDHLQRGYAELLAEALGNRKGTAVIEVEEARQIAREAALAGEGDLKRLVPVFVEGEYEVALTPAAETERPVTFRVKLTGADGKGRSLPEQVVRLSEAPDYVGGQLASLVTGLEQDTQAMSVDDQVRALIARAEAFAALGNLPLSTGLREAALLIRDDPAGRKVLLQEYMKDIAGHKPYPQELAAEPDRWQQEGERCFAVWHVAMSHVEYLIRNRQTTAEQAAGMALHLIWQAHRTATADIGLRAAPDAEKARKRFIREVVPLWFADLQPPVSAMYYLRDYLGGMVVHHLDGESWQAEDLEMLADLMENVLPVSNYVVIQLERVAPLYRGGFTREQYLRFLDRVAAMNRPADSMAARYGKLRFLYSERFAEKKPAADLLRDTEALLAEIYQHPDIARYSLPLPTAVKHLAIEIRDGLAPGKSTAFVSNATGHPEENTPTRVRFEEVPMKLQTLDGRTLPADSFAWPMVKGSWWRQLRRMTSCGDGLDVFCASGAVVAQRKAGLLEEWFVDDTAHFDEVPWDGRNVWIATRHAGLWVVSPDGKVLAKVGEADGLPPCDLRAVVHPLEPGKVCAIGTFGPQRRAWCAIAQWSAAGPKVNVFHQATKTLLVTDEQTNRAEPDLAFLPGWTCPYRLAGRPSLLVGRIGHTEATRQRPLVIDLETLKVSVFPRALATVESGGVHELNNYCGAYYAHEDSLLESARTLTVYAPSDKSHASALGVVQSHDQYDHSFGFYRWLLLYDGWVHAPGNPWMRFHAKTLAPEQLTPQAFYDHPPIRYFGVSAHQGLIGWTESQKFYRVVIDLGPPPP